MMGLSLPLHLIPQITVFTESLPWSHLELIQQVIEVKMIYLTLLRNEIFHLCTF